MIKRLPFMQKIEFYKTAVKLVMLGNEQEKGEYVEICSSKKRYLVRCQCYKNDLCVLGCSKVEVRLEVIGVADLK